MRRLVPERQNGSELERSVRAFPVPRGFFESKAWRNQRKILYNLGEPKTFAQLCRLLADENKIHRPKSSVSYALRELIRRGEVLGVIDEDTLKKTGNRMVPVFKLTGYHPIFHGGGPKDQPTDGSDYTIMRVYKDEKGNLIGKQYVKKIKKKARRGAIRAGDIDTRETTDRKISPVIPIFNQPRRVVCSRCGAIFETTDLNARCACGYVTVIPVEVLLNLESHHLVPYGARNRISL